MLEFSNFVKHMLMREKQNIECTINHTIVCSDMSFVVFLKSDDQKRNLHEVSQSAYSNKMRII